MEGENVLPRFNIKTFGCQMNVYDTDRLRTALMGREWEESSEQDADVLVFITCSIRAKAEQKVLSDLGRCGERWRQSGKPRVALLGCMAQRIGKKTALQCPWICLVAGPRHLGVVPDALLEAYTEEQPRLYLDDDPRGLEDLCTPPLERTNQYKAFVTIAHGCDHFCSYCIVPYVRGRFQSRRAELILNEARTLVESGVREIMLLGQNVNSYGSDLEGQTFAQLLQAMASIPGLLRLRFTTSHPVDFGDDILTVMQNNPVIAPSINLAVQSGSDVILKEMNRGYSRAQYMEAIGRIRAAIPGVALTTDIIVGFPGETDQDFQDSLELLRSARFDMAHTASYSPREGTVAAKREDTIPPNIKAARLDELNRLQAAIGLEINLELEGQVLDVLFDDKAGKGEGLLQGRTATDKVVIVRSTEENLGKILPVRIKSATAWSLEGEIV